MIETVYVNTCVYGAQKFSRIPDYVEEYGDRIGFEILSMFDLPDFEPVLRENLSVLKKQKISFHGPVFEAEHSAKKGTPEYERTMYHVSKTFEYARELHSSHFTMHLNNCEVAPEKKEEMLSIALKNYEEIRELFAPIGCHIYIENTGTLSQGNLLLDQREFTELCREKGFEVLVDIGHANANGWDIPKLIHDLSGQIKAYHLHNNDGVHDQHRRLHDGTMDFDAVLTAIRRETKEAELIIEYVRQEQEGPGLHEDIRFLLGEP